MRKLLSTEDVAKRLRKSAGWVRDNAARLTEEDGFPPPVRLGVLTRKRLLWDSEAVERWMSLALDGQMPKALQEATASDAWASHLQADLEAAAVRAIRNHV